MRRLDKAYRSFFMSIAAAEVQEVRVGGLVHLPAGVQWKRAARVWEGWRRSDRFPSSSTARSLEMACSRYAPSAGRRRRNNEFVES
ncbi:MAG: hypothetical protein JRN66_07045 [Nitrososphaerota archaeon]|nr:hypothetical protein [Nitrososphaerota archaeon]